MSKALSSVPFLLLQQPRKHAVPEMGDVGCSEGVKSPGRFGRVAVPGLRGAGGRSTTSQHFPLISAVSVQRLWGSIAAGASQNWGSIMQKDVAFSSFIEEAVSWFMCRTGPPGKQEPI